MLTTLVLCIRLFNISRTEIQQLIAEMGVESDEDLDMELTQSKNCGMCNTKLTQKCLYCNICDILICQTCLGVSSKLFEALNEKKTNSSAVMIVCKPCRNKAFRSIKKQIMNEDKQENAVKKIEEIADKVDSMAKVMETKIKLFESISEKNDDHEPVLTGMNEQEIKNVIKSTYAEALKDNVEHHEEMKGAVKQAISEKQKEDNTKNREQQRNNTIFLYNCPESEIIDIEERIKDEEKTVDNFITEGIKISKIEIKSMYRVGKFQKDIRMKPRPIRVTFEDKFATVKLFKNIANLKEAEDKYKAIKVERELSKTEREEHLKKLKEVKTLNEKNTDKTKYYVLRGTPKNPVIKTIPATQKAE